ncbi:MAG: hypothetical protein HYW07_23930 [Candidatus Latescibacteria bacterium]|nr:hypothetical protein [Candidatus Latescibacterota bacterium]
MSRTVLSAGVLLATLWAATARGANPELRATIVDRMGNQHQVAKFSYQDRAELEYFVGDQPRAVQLADIARFRLDGEREDEEVQITLTWRNGNSETGRIFTGGSGIAPHQDALGSGQVSNRLSGVTELGPFFILLSDVREVILLHPASLAPAKEPKLKATVVDLEGRRFEVHQLRYRGQLRLDFTQGRKQRSIDLAKISRIEFTEERDPGTEFRPIILTFWSGKTLQGTVDASTVRLGGETDRIYQLRVGAAFTGELASGPFAIGLQDLKLVRFYPEEEEESKAPAKPESPR